MTEFQPLVTQLKQALHQTSEYQVYQELQKAITTHPTLALQEEELKDLQKAMVAALDEKRSEDYEKFKASYESKKQDFDEHPLVHNLRLAKEELNDLLVEIAHLIEQGLSDLPKSE